MLDSGSELRMTARERSNSNVLVIEPDARERNNIKTALKSLGYGGLSDVPSHAAAFDKLSQRNFTHVIFDARSTNMPPKAFLAKLLEAQSGVIAIPCSFDPQIDEVFDMLIMGARGFLVKPFTTDTVEHAIVMATKGEPMSDAVLQAKDRNEALVAIMMASLDKVAVILRQASQFETAKREIPKVMTQFRVASELARTFAKDGQEGILIALEKFCIERSKGPATRLGRLRKRLQTNRGDEIEAG